MRHLDNTLDRGVRWLRCGLCAAIVMAAHSAVGGDSGSVASSTAVQLQPPRSAAPARPPAEADDREFLRAAARAIAHGQRADAARLATARGGADHAAAAILARLDADAGRLGEALSRVQALGTARPTGEAALEWGLVLLKQGKDEARQVLAPVAATYRSAATPHALLRAGRAARALGQTRTANTILREAAAQAKDDPAVQTEWGALFLDTHNPGEAAGSFRAALALDAQWAPAHAGLARALADEDPAAAEAAARRAAEIDPALVDAHLFLAEFEANHDRMDRAMAALGRALEANPRSPDAQAFAAAFAFVTDRTGDFDQAVARALAVNPSFGRVFLVPAEFAASNFRYHDAVALARRAVATERDNPRTHAALGLHLLRVGGNRESRRALEAAFRADAYDLVTYNLLQMLDRLDEFASFPTGNALIRLDPIEAPVLRHYAVPLVDQAMAQMTARYGFEPKGPISVEVFSKHDDFAVRTQGLPGLLGALGVCFGQVVTLDSPRARPGTAFNWQATLWHEMAHVFTMQMSNYRVPRWLTEGISVWEEGHVKPEWARDSELVLARAHAEGKVPKLADLNAAFTRAGTVELAYFQASLVVGLIADQHGERAVGNLVKAFAKGVDTDAALRLVTKQGLPELQAAFDARMAQRYDAIGRALLVPEGVDLASVKTPAAWQALAAKHRESYAIQMAAGDAMAAAGLREAALDAYGRAHTLVPTATGAASARARAAELAERSGDLRRALREWQSLVADDHDNAGAARRLLPIARRLGQQDAVRLALERIVTLDPFDSAAHTALGRVALESGDLALATREFRAALAAGPADVAPAHCDLGEAALAGGDHAEAKRAALAALEVAPSYARAQDLLLKIVDRK